MKFLIRDNIVVVAVCSSFALTHLLNVLNLFGTKHMFLEVSHLLYFLWSSLCVEIVGFVIYQHYFTKKCTETVVVTS